MRAAVLVLVVAACVAVCAQSPVLETAGNALHVKASGLRIVQGPLLARLKDGRSVRVEVEMAMLAAPNGREIAKARQRFTISFDIWEERFVVTRSGTPPRSVSLAEAADADAWCVENVTVPLASVARHPRTSPVWVRLSYRIDDASTPGTIDTDTGFTLGGLIDRLSRRRASGDAGESIETGPLRLPD